MKEAEFDDELKDQEQDPIDEEGGEKEEPIPPPPPPPMTSADRDSKAQAAQRRIKGKTDIYSGDVSVTTKTAMLLRDQPKVRVIISSTETDKADVVVSVNGHTYQIQRDKEVLLPHDVAQVLIDAKKIEYTQRPRTEIGPNGERPEGNEMVPHEVARFPLQIMG